jgi:hypothetical protein
MKIKATLSIGFCTANRKTEIEIDDEELEDLSEEEKDKVINEYVQNWAENYIETYWEIKE